MRSKMKTIRSFTLINPLIGVGPSTSPLTYIATEMGTNTPKGMDLLTCKAPFKS